MSTVPVVSSDKKGLYLTDTFEKMTIAHQVDYIWHQLMLQGVGTSELEDTCKELGQFVTSSDRASLADDPESCCSPFDFNLWLFNDGSAIALPLFWSPARPPLVFPHFAQHVAQNVKTPQTAEPTKEVAA